jgi:hypothetical protein
VTNKQAIESFLGFGQGNDDQVNIQLAVQGVDPVGTFDLTKAAESIVPIEKAALEVMRILLTTADNTNDQPLYTIKWDRVAVLKRIQALEYKYGLVTDSTPTITSVRVW